MRKLFITLSHHALACSSAFSAQEGSTLPITDTRSMICLSTHAQSSNLATLRPMSDPPLPYSLAIVTTLNTLHPLHCREQMPLLVSTLRFASFSFCASITSMHSLSFRSSLAGFVLTQNEGTRYH